VSSLHVWVDQVLADDTHASELGLST